MDRRKELDMESQMFFNNMQEELNGKDVFLTTEGEQAYMLQLDDFEVGSILHEHDTLLSIGGSEFENAFLDVKYKDISKIYSEYTGSNSYDVEDYHIILESGNEILLEAF
jgi:hypothetical protein